MLLVLLSSLLVVCLTTTTSTTHAQSVFCEFTCDNQVHDVYVGNKSYYKSIYNVVGVPQRLATLDQKFGVNAWIARKGIAFEEPIVPTQLSFLLAEQDAVGQPSKSGFGMLCVTDPPDSTNIWHNFKTCHNATSDPECTAIKKWPGGISCGSNAASCGTDYFLPPPLRNDTVLSVAKTTSGFTLAGTDSAFTQKNLLWLNIVGPKFVVLRKTFPVARAFDPNLDLKAPTVCSNPDLPGPAFNGRCYHFSHLHGAPGKTQATQPAAASFCQDIGGSLLSINSEEEQEYVHASTRCGSSPTSNSCWIGLSRQGSLPTALYQWVDSSVYVPIQTITTFPTQTSFQLFPSISSGTACVVTNGLTSWTEVDCSSSRSFVCAASASCDPGYKRIRSYKSWPNAQGLCEQCPAGTYRSSTDPEGECKSCLPGFLGVKGETKPNCTQACPFGFFCSGGTPSGAQVPCPAGKFALSGNITRDSEFSACGVCPGGSFCLGGVTPPQLCARGRCSQNLVSNPACSENCPAGYYCPEGSACLSVTKQSEAQGLFECGYDFASNTSSPNQFYCEAGSFARLPVPEGFFSVGQTSMTRFEIAICPIGSYCTLGERIPCPAGTFRSSTGARSVGECLPCSAGYFCLAGSGSSTQIPCSSETDTNPANFFCPAGSGARQTVPTGHESLPRDGSVFTRVSTQACEQDHICTLGIRSPRITWNSNSCPGNIASTSVFEMSPANNPVLTSNFTAKVDLNSALTLENYNITYRVQSYSFALGAQNPSCEANTEAKNGNGLFAVNLTSGALFLTRSNLNFEICGSLTDIRYNLIVRAIAVGDNTTSQSDCALQVRVLDANDKPFTLIPESYFQIEEQSERNSPVKRCDALAVSNNGCPVNQANEDPELVNTVGDEDLTSDLFFSITPGKFDHPSDPNQAQFKINECTGLISLVKNRDIKFSSPTPRHFDNRPVYKLEITARDDGNGGAFPSLNTTMIVYVFITNKNDPPVLPSPSLVNFVIYENSPVGTKTSPASLINLVTDDDLDPITLSLLAAGNNEFSLNGNDVQLTLLGSQTIDFESSSGNSNGVFPITIGAFDGKEIASETYFITVLDANDPPVFVDGLLFYVKENSPIDTAVCRTEDLSACVIGPNNGENQAHSVRVTDQDFALHASEDQIEFSLTINPGNGFRIHPTTGQIFVNTSALNFLDFEDESLSFNGGTGRARRVTVQACSSGFGSVIETSSTKCRSAQAIIFLIDENEQPVFSNTLFLSARMFVLEQVEPLGKPIFANESTLLAISATDPDNRDVLLFSSPAPVQSFSYSIVPTGLPTDGSAIFSVSTSANGRPLISLNQAVSFSGALTSGCTLSNSRCYHIRLRVTDNPGANQAQLFSDSPNLEIEVVATNSIPFFSIGQSLIRTFSEDLDPSAQSIHPTILSAQDLDGDNLDFEIVGGTGRDFFELVSAGSGGVRIAKRVNTELDFEGPLGNNFFLTVKVFDKGPSSRVGSTCFGVDDDCGFISGSGGASCRADKRCYEICSAVSGGGGASAQAVTERGVRNGYFCQYLPGEIPSQTFPDSALIRVDVSIIDENDPPIIQSNLVDVFGNDVNRAGGDCVIVRSVIFNINLEQNITQENSIVFLDEDTDPLLQTSNPLFSQGTGLGQDSDFWNHFQISSNGRIFIPENLGIGYLIQNKVYNGTIHLSDQKSPPLSSQCRIQVKAVLSNTIPSLADPPIVIIAENAAPGTLIHQRLGASTAAIDPDVGATLRFTSSISGAYTVGLSDGQIRVGSEGLDFESLGLDRILTILVLISDEFGGSTIVTVRLNVTDVNERPVLVNQIAANFEINENLPNGSVVGVALSNFVTDPDTNNPAFNVLNYTLISGCPAPCPFQVNSVSGVITVVNDRLLDFESPVRNSWELVIQIQDNQGLSTSQPLLVPIKLKNVNEAPRFILPEGVTHFDFFEDDNAVGVSRELIDLTTVTVDDDIGDLFTFELVNSTVGFSLSGSILSFSGALDFENPLSHSVTIIARDQNSAGTSPTVFQVVAKNVNDVVITGVSKLTNSNTPLSCNGGEVVVIQGKNFGFVGGSPSVSVFVDYFYKTSVGENTISPVYSAQACNVTVQNTEIQCRTLPGVGTDIGWRVRVQHSTFTDVSPAFSRLSFQSPSISSILGASDVPTTGGLRSITVQGTCLGILSDAVNFVQRQDSFVRYCSANGGACYFPNCNSSNTLRTEINCVMVPGIGKDFTWNVKIAQQVSNSIIQGNYAIPSLTGISRSIIPTNGSVPLVISGSNFDDNGNAPSLAQLRYSFFDSKLGSNVTRTFRLNGCLVTSPVGLRNEVTCSSFEPGVGRDVSVIIEFGNQQNNPNDLLLQFENAIVTSLEGPGVSGAATFGGQLVTVRGSSFGPLCGVSGSEACPYVKAMYSKNLTSPFQYHPPCAVVQQDRMVCIIVEGTGAGHVWRFSIGDITVTVLPNVTTTSYGRPSVGAYNGPGARDAPTNGGDSIFLIGSNFGPMNGAPITGFYGNQSNPAEFFSGSCQVTKPHTEVRCSTAPGAGKDLAWTLIVDGIESQGATMDYAVPVITDITGLTGLSREMNGDGGQTIFLIGENFGPNFASPRAPTHFPYLTSVFFGPSENPSAFALESCVVLSHSQIRCITTPGTAFKPLSWQVLIADQLSPPSSVTTSYPFPTITSISPSTGNTAGNYLLTIEGSGFGLCDSSVTQRVFVDNDDFTIISKLDEDGNRITNLATQCPLPSNVQRLVISVPEMKRVDRMQISVRIQSSRFSETVLAAGSPRLFSYESPEIQSIFAEPVGDSESIRVTIIGENFCASELCCITHVSGIPSSNLVEQHSHSKIVFVAPAAGSVFIRCPSVDSNLAEFNTFNPVVIGTVPPLGAQEFNTQGGVQVQIWGLYFGLAAPEITIGHRIAQVVNHSIISCLDSSRPSTASESSIRPTDSCFVTTIIIPEGQGKNQALVVTAGGQGSFPQDIRYEFLSYGDPEIFSVTGPGVLNLNPTIGGNNFTLSGQNFGLNGTVWLGFEFDLECTQLNWSHTEIVCQVPKGEGFGLNIQVESSGFITPPFADEVIRYVPPRISSWELLPPGVNGSALTQGGELFKIIGTNFGRQQKANVLIGNRDCIIQSFDSVSHSEATCLTPQGEGTNLQIDFFARDQKHTSSELFAYGLPEIFSVFPLTGPTAGRNYSTNETIYLEIFGKNFGIDRLRIEFNGTVLATRIDATFANHTYIKIPLPNFFGLNNQIRVVVAARKNLEENFLFNFFAPTAVRVRFRLDGVIDEEIDTVNIPAAGFTPPREAFLPRQNLNNRLLSSNRELQSNNNESFYGSWSSNFTTCTARIEFPNLYWRQKQTIDEFGNYERRTEFFSDNDCSISSLGLIESGFYEDFGPLLSENAFSCAQKYSDTLLSAIVTPRSTEMVQKLSLDSECGSTWSVGSQRLFNMNATVCSTVMQFIRQEEKVFTQFTNSPRFGIYIISDKKDIYLSTPLASSLSNVDELTAYRFPQDPSASVIDSERTIAVEGPTDGCWEYEDIITYNERVLESIINDGVAIIPRVCLDPATLEITGEDFGNDDNNIPDSLQVFFVNEENGDEFKGSTTTSIGSSGFLCERPFCLHTDTKIRFQIPVGVGANLKIKIVVGGVPSIVPNITFNYMAPILIDQVPGSVWSRRAFADANGNQTLSIRGKNFGFGGTSISVLVNGRICSNATWQSGAQDEDGQPFIRCFSPQDVVGPKSIFVCAGNRTTVNKVSRQDVNVLLAGELVNAWTQGFSSQGFHSQLTSFSVSRCGLGQTGRLYEVCRPCPSGAKCDPSGSFTAPKATSTYFKYDIPILNEEGEINEKAIARCAPPQYNISLVRDYPDLVIRETCEDFVRCIPPESCLAENQCAEGYEYVVKECRAKRAGLNNSCSISLNSLTGEYEGDHNQCLGSTTKGNACPIDKPEECSLCVVKFDNNSIPFGECECQMPTRCALCTVGEYFRFSGKCAICPSSPELLIVIFILVAFAIVGAGYILQKKNFNLAFISIGIDYFQVLALLSTTDVIWPQELLNLFHVFSFFNFNIDLAAPECIVPDFSYETKWYFTEMLPIGAFSVLVIFSLVITFSRAIYQGTKASYMSKIDTFISTGLVMMYYMYLSVTKRALDVFNCNPSVPSDGELYTTFTSRDCDGGQLCRCNEPGGLQQRLVPMAYVFLVLYMIGFPAVILFIYLKNRRATIIDQYIRAAGFGDDRASNPYFDIRKRYSRLYYHFKPMYTYWIILILGRKMGIAISVLLLRGNAAFQLAVVLLVLFASFVLQVLHRPYLSTVERGPILDDLYSKATRSEFDSSLKIYNVFLAELRAAEKLHQTDLRKQKEKKFGGDVATVLWGNSSEQAKGGKRDVKRTKIGGIYLFDFNTVEMVLLGCAILLSLAGLMFASDRFDGREDLIAQRNAITYIAFIIVVFSITYYFTVLLAELAPSMVGWLIKKFCMNRAPVSENRIRNDSLQTAENPMFSTTGPAFADTAELEGKLTLTASELALEEQKNKKLRERIRDAKQREAEINVHLNTGATAPVAKPNARKVFGQQQT